MRIVVVCFCTTPNLFAAPERLSHVVKITKIHSFLFFFFLPLPLLPPFILTFSRRHLFRMAEGRVPAWRLLPLLALRVNTLIEALVVGAGLWIGTLTRGHVEGLL